MNRLESLLLGTGAAMVLAAVVLLLAGCAPTIAPAPKIDPALLRCEAIAPLPWNPTMGDGYNQIVDYRSCCAAACDQLAKIGAAVR